MYHDPHTISVWFVCKPCRRSFLKIEDFFRHKNEHHFVEFQNYKCIVFEERVVLHEAEPDENNVAELGLQESFQSPHPSSFIKYETENEPAVNITTDHTLIFQAQNDIPPAVVDLRLVKQESVPTNENENENENEDNETDSTNFYGIIQAPQHSYRFVSDSAEIRIVSPSFSNDVVTEMKREILDDCPGSNSNYNTNYEDDNFYLTEERPRNSVIINSSSQSENENDNRYSHHILNTDRNLAFQRPNDINNFWSQQASIISRNSAGAIECCKLCSKKFFPGPDMSTHLALCLLTSKNRKCFCSPCNKLFCNVQTLQNHNRSFHTSDEERAERYKFACQLCPKKFIQEASLLSHTNSHRNKSQEPKLRPFICFHCNLTFALSAQLSVHLRTHLDERPYECLAPNCGKAFKFKRNLDDHMIVHSDSRPFACPFDGCGKTFKVKMNCTIHLRTHTGERPYKCMADNCGKSYLTASNLNHHVTIMHGKF